MPIYDSYHMNKLSFVFWYKWLLGVSILNILIGVLIAFTPSNIIFSYYLEAIGDTFFRGNITEEIHHLRTFLFGIIGGTISGYFLMQTFIVWIPFYRKERWAWHAILWAIVLWFTIDSSLSIYHGAYFNIWMINIWSLLLTLLPLIMTYSEFKKSSIPCTFR